MSLFEIKAVCEETQFYSLYIDPQIPAITGTLNLSNGHTTNTAAPDQTFTFNTIYSQNASTNNHLQIMSQPRGQQPVLALDIAPNGAVNIPTSLVVNGKPVTGSSSVGGVSQETVDAMQSQINGLTAYIQELKALIRSLKESIYIDNNGQEFDYTNLLE